MADPFLSEIKIVSFDFPPRGWAFCDGQILPINQNQALFALLGTIYGGNGITTFGLPDLRGRVPLHADATFLLGGTSGEKGHALSPAEMPAHAHALLATSDAALDASPSGGLLARADAAVGNVYAPGPPNTPLAPGSVATIEAGLEHENRQPFLALNFVIALQGIFPDRN